MEKKQQQWKGQRTEGKEMGQEKMLRGQGEDQRKALLRSDGRWQRGGQDADGKKKPRWLWAIQFRC